MSSQKVEHATYILARYTPKFVRKVFRNMSYFKLIFGNFQQRLPGLEQKILTFNSNVELSEIPETLKELFDRASIKFIEGTHLLYVFRKRDIATINEDLVKNYPGSIGMKIFFSTERSSDGSVYYISNRFFCNNSYSFYTKSVGSIKEKMVISNIFSISNMAPLVYDIINLKYQDILLQAMVVEHIKGKVVHGQKGSRFLEDFFKKMEEEQIEIISEKTLTPNGFKRIDVDISPPTYNNNIIQNRNSTFYIDIQNFRLKTKDAFLKMLPSIREKTHFGEVLPFRGGKYSYQSIPFLGVNGKRNTSKRFKMFDYLLPENDIQVEGSRVLDVGCNLGIFIAYFLNRGASWCTGVDLPEIADLAKRFLFYQGFSRFDLMGCDLKNMKMPFNKQEYEVILYLSISHHIGFPDWLNETSFKSFIFEGKEGQNVEDAKNILLERFPDMRVVFEDKVKDGDCGYRPFVILK